MRLVATRSHCHHQAEKPKEPGSGIKVQEIQGPLRGETGTLSTAKREGEESLVFFLSSAFLFLVSALIKLIPKTADKEAWRRELLLVPSNTTQERG